MTVDRPAIPDPMKREVRQRCGFGCVLCGIPLYHYDHMVDFAIVQEHTAENLTLLCARHHDEKTRGLLSADAIAAANADPCNVREGRSAGLLLHYASGMPMVLLGGNYITSPTGSFRAVVVDDIPIVAFRIEDERILLDMTLFDEMNFPCLVIRDNELALAADLYDVELVGQVLTVRTDTRRILIEMRFSPPEYLELTRGQLLCNGTSVDLRPDGVWFNGERLINVRGNSLEAECGLAVGRRETVRSAAIVVKDLNRYRHLPATTPDADAIPPASGASE
ncbi:MAG: hypothetical protein QOG49_1254 [Frankiaceae bacterium]|nr:hypothetical protein [Frankiaceae bacterium]